MSQQPPSEVGDSSSESGASPLPPAPAEAPASLGLSAAAASPLPLPPEQYGRAPLAGSSLSAPVSAASPALADDLQFDTVEPVNRARPQGSVAPAGGPGMAVCAGCRRPISTSYFAVGGKVACPDCIAKIQRPLPGSPVLRVVKATVMGFGVGLLGAAAWFAVRYFAHLEVGLIAIAVGYMVGKAVRKGSGNRGGRGYQLLAVALTYLCICLNYAPDIVMALVQDARDDQSTNSPEGAGHGTGASHVNLGEAAAAVAVVGGAVVLLCLKAPFIGGAQNALGILIIGIGLLQAWRINVPRSLSISGPYQVGSARAGAGGISMVPLPARGGISGQGSHGVGS